MRKKDTVAIIQARMNSTRLPGKVLMDICGQTMISHVVTRVCSCRSIDSVLVATTVSAPDDAVERHCRKLSIPCFRGSEDDVLDRYYKAALEAGAKTVVRITADCPVIDPAITDKVVEAYFAHKDSYAGACNTIIRTYPRGLDTEAVSIDTLAGCWKAARHPIEREHVLVYAYEHPHEYPMFNVLAEEDGSNYRWTVDEERDLRFIREIYERLYSKKRLFDRADIIELIRNNPSLVEINRGVEQKTA